MNKRQCGILICILACAAMLPRCMQRKPEDPRGRAYAGHTSCASCHKAIYDNYLRTAHYATSAPADSASVKGRFSPPDNVFTFAGGDQVRMEDRHGKLFQNDVAFDITVGSGTKAQTYLYWKNGKYFQLPLSYFVLTDSWANSPGFPASHPKFDREIPSTCFGCHSSMVEVGTEAKGTGYTERFGHNKLVYGIDCERCHGPAAQHVDYHTEHPGEREAKFMVKIGEMQHQRQLDLCAMCHSGLKTPNRSAFLYRPGDDLNDYFFPDIGRPAKPKEMDVHGTQYQLFTASKCFTANRRTMTCSSCHDPHQPAQQERQEMAARCTSCHASTKHTFEMEQAKIISNCIDCHMPKLPSSIKLLAKGKMVADSVRTHLIAVYPEITERVLLMH